LIPIHKVFEYFHLNDDPQVPLELLLGPEAFVAKNHKITWADFACCAFYHKLLGLRWPEDRLKSICEIVYPEIKKNVESLSGTRAIPLIVLLIDNEFMLLGDNRLYDMKTWQEMDQAEFEQRNMFQMSVCFMVSFIVLLEARRFVKKEPTYAPGCPFVGGGPLPGETDPAKSLA
jgi:hypothetical protein